MHTFIYRDLQKRHTIHLSISCQILID